jgi:triphosphoribosyl-dephospho-CoA synthetase
MKISLNEKENEKDHEKALVSCVKALRAVFQLGLRNAKALYDRIKEAGPQGISMDLRFVPESMQAQKRLEEGGFILKPESPEEATAGDDKTIQGLLIRFQEWQREVHMVDSLTSREEMVAAANDFLETYADFVNNCTDRSPMA